MPASLSMVFTELLEQAGGAGFFQALQVLTFFLPSVWVPIQLVVENFSAAVLGHCCCAHMLDNGSEAPGNLTPEALLAVSIPRSPNQEPHQCLRFRQPQWQLLDPQRHGHQLERGCHGATRGRLGLRPQHVYLHHRDRGEGLPPTRPSQPHHFLPSQPPNDWED